MPKGYIFRPLPSVCLGIKSRWGGEIFRTCPDQPWGPPSLLYNGYRVFPGIKSGRGVTLTPHPLLVPWPRKSRAIPLLHIWAVRPVQSLSPCTRAHFTFTLQLYLYSPYGPYGLYRASLPVQGGTLPLPYSRAIPLLPLWAVRPVQSLSACTRVHFTFTLQ